jgi:putative SOS response-associated peptidase YedK
MWSGNDEKAYKSCTIVTTDASDSVKSIHDRMPVILKPEHYQAWLNSKNKDPEAIQQILRDGIVIELSCRMVSPMVNSVRHNDVRNIEAV